VLMTADWSLRGLPNFPVVPNQGRATIWPESPVCRFATIAPSESYTCYFAAPRRHRTWGVSMVVLPWLALNLVESGGGLRCFNRTLSSRWATSNGKTRSRRLETYQGCMCCRRGRITPSVHPWSPTPDFLAKFYSPSLWPIRADLQGSRRFVMVRSSSPVQAQTRLPLSKFVLCCITPTTSTHMQRLCSQYIGPFSCDYWNRVTQLSQRFGLSQPQLCWNWSLDVHMT